MPLEKVEVARVEARLRAELSLPNKLSKLVVDFGCDAAGAIPEEVVYEDGSGHGGSLRIARFQRDARGVSVTLVDYDHHHAGTLEVSGGGVETDPFDDAVARSRVALVARPHVIPLKDGRDYGLGFKFTFSSADVHLRLSIADRDGDTIDRGFTGYVSSGAQESYLPMRLAAAPIQKLLSRAALTPRSPSAEDRRFVTDRFLLTFAETPEWWVRERYIGIVAKLGTTDAVPTLVRVANERTDVADASTERTRTAALDAVASLTGFDPWHDGTAERRDVDTAAAAAAAACNP